jgi:zinc protease
MDHAEMLLGQMSTANATVAEAIEVIRAEWAHGRKRHHRRRTCPRQDLPDRAYPLRFDGNAQIARILVGMQMIGLPPDYVPTATALSRR